MWISQLSVSSPRSWPKVKEALSPRVSDAGFTELESLGQPEPEILRDVIFAGEGGMRLITSGVGTAEAMATVPRKRTDRMVMCDGEERCETGIFRLSIQR